MPTRSNGVANGHPSSGAAKHDLAPHFIGGNHLSAAAPSKVRNFVQSHDGHTVITNVSQPHRSGKKQKGVVQRWDKGTIRSGEI